MKDCVSRNYLINGSTEFPGYCVVLRSVVISLAAFTLIGLTLWIIIGEPDHNLSMGCPVRFNPLRVWGLYTAPAQ